METSRRLCTIARQSTPAMSLVIIAAIVADAIVVLSIVIWAFRSD